jgi:hypothetical protein
MKSPTVFLRQLLIDMGNWCCVDTTNDYKTVVGRIEKEGSSFLTITLPNFAADLQKGLEQGYVDSSLFFGFKKKGVIPLFLGGMLSLIFNPSDGSLLEEPSTTAIRSIRQFTLMWKKVKLPCSDERVDNAMVKYLECESDVREFDRSFCGPLKEDFERIGRILFRELFSDIDLMVYNGNKEFNSLGESNNITPLVPKHGPGSTADGLLGNKKYYQFEWTSRLERCFPFGEYAVPNWRAFLELSDQLTIREPWDEIAVEVIPVPKTLKTPRLIAREPTCMQYMQQALLEAIERGIEEDDILDGFISTRSQLPNRLLAKVGSETGSLATLDLSEASDRVSNQHVRSLLANHPHLFGAVDACRSRKADVPGHSIIRLAKFASMGSALCFPFESMVFLTAVFLGIERKLSGHLDKKIIRSFLGKVRVYGDDIIVPVEYADSVYETLELFGFKVNRRKSFWNGKFRESCGAEYYNGVDVSVTYVREVLPSSRKDSAGIVSTVSLLNHLNQVGAWNSVQFLEELLERFIRLPRVSETSAILGKVVSHDFTVDKMHPELQIPLVRGSVVSTKRRSNAADSWPALMKWYLKRGDLPFADRDHLLYSGRPVSVDIKTRYGSPV